MDPTTVFFNRLPLPLGQVLLRTQNAKNIIEQHNNAFFLGELALKLAAAIRISVYIHHAKKSERIDELLHRLVRPSFGHWVNIFRDTDHYLANQKDKSLFPLTEIFGSIHRDPLHSPNTDFLIRFSEENDIIQDSRQYIRRGVLGYFEFLNAYRNIVLGHGAQRNRQFYEQMYPLLLLAAKEVLTSPCLFGSCQLFYSVNRNGGQIVQKLSLSMDEGRFSGPAFPPNQIPGGVFFADQKAVISLDPFVIYDTSGDSEEDSVCILNEISKEKNRSSGFFKQAKYLNYNDGNVMTVNESSPVLIKLFDILGKSVFSIDDFIEEEVQREPKDNALFIGDYEILGELGQGASGVVYKALQKSMKRTVALKILRSGLYEDHMSLKRFRVETRALAKCDHPNIVKIFYSGQDQSRYFYAMEFVDGVELSMLIKKLNEWSSREIPFGWDTITSAIREIERGQNASQDFNPFDFGIKQGKSTRKNSRKYFQRVAMLFSQVSEGLHHLHQKRIIHRDIKPGNLIITRDDERIVITDLGLAKIFDASFSMTRDSNRVIGTLNYLAPEQLINPQNCDARTDIYCLGATLYEFVTGKTVFQIESELAAYQKILKETPTPPNEIEPSVPLDLSYIIMKCLAKDPEDRYFSAYDLAEDLRKFSFGNKVLSYRIPKKWVLGSLGVAMVFAAAYFLSTLSTGNKNQFKESSTVESSTVAPGKMEEKIDTKLKENETIEYCTTVVPRGEILECLPDDKFTKSNRVKYIVRKDKDGKIIEVSRGFDKYLRRLYEPNPGYEFDEFYEYVFYDYYYGVDGNLRRVKVTDKDGLVCEYEISVEKMNEDGEREYYKTTNSKKNGCLHSIQVVLDSKGFKQREFFRDEKGAPQEDKYGFDGYKYDRKSNGELRKRIALKNHAIEMYMNYVGSLKESMEVIFGFYNIQRSPEENPICKCSKLQIVFDKSKEMFDVIKETPERTAINSKEEKNKKEIKNKFAKNGIGTITKAHLVQGRGDAPLKLTDAQQKELDAKWADAVADLQAFLASLQKIQKYQTDNASVTPVELRTAVTTYHAMNEKYPNFLKYLQATGDVNQAASKSIAERKDIAALLKIGSSDTPGADTAEGDCSKVWCMLKNNEPECCAAFRKNVTSASSSEDDPCANNPNETLEPSNTKDVMGTIRSAVNACFSQYGIIGTVTVRVSVGCMGNVQNAMASGEHASTPLGKCIAKAVMGAKFPKFKRPTSKSFSYPFVGGRNTH